MMNKRVKVFSTLLFGGVLCLTAVSVKAPKAQADDLDDMIARLQSEVSGLDKLQNETEKNISDVEEKYKDELSKAASESMDYDAKIARAKAKRRIDRVEVSGDSEIDLFGEGIDENKTVTETSAPVVQKTEPKETVQKTEAKETIKYPLERSPRYVAPKKNNIKNGRRPFTRSENEVGVSELYFARVSHSESLSFAKEDEGEGASTSAGEDSVTSYEGYSGTTEENVFLFSDNLANYCEVDTQSLDKMPDCMAKILKDKSSPSQSVKDNVATMHAESLQDATSQAVAEAAGLKNASSGFEKNVLVPLQEKSSKSTDERGDIEVLSFADMESLKLKNKLLQAYATMLAYEAFRAFGAFEINGNDLTNIDDEFNALNENKENK